MASEAEGVIIVVFTDDKESQALNSRYRGKSKPTDVLSFVQNEYDEEEAHIGDLVISLQVAKRQAKEYEVTLLDELSRLVVHGSLHLLGYEHEKVKPYIARRMRDREEKILGELA